MAIDPGTAALLVGGPVLGGVLGAFSQRKQLKKSEALQREFAQHGIQWRVEDAKRAGLHPLFALGASTSGPTIPIMDDPLGKSISEAGQNLGRARLATESQDKRNADSLALQIGGSQIARNYAEASYFDSMAARNYQQGLGSVGVPLTPSPAQVFGGQATPGIQVVPSQSVAHAPGEPGIEAAVGTGLKSFNMPGGRSILLPAANSFGEALEPVSESLSIAWIVARENIKHNPNFLRENAHWFPYGEELFQIADSVERGRRMRAAQEGEDWRSARPGMFKRGVIERLFNIPRR